MGDFVPGGAGFETQGMPAGSGRKTTIDIPIFSSILPGSYWVTVFADSFEAVAESDESNNMASSDPNRITVNPSTSTLSPTADSRALTSIPLEEALASGKPTLADFGYRVCEACKAMAVIWQELAVEYQGKLNVVIVDVYEQKELTRQYRIMAIPTQIVFDSTGKEITRHMGFWPKEKILALLKEMGIE
jgi:thioredoxin 1